MAFIPVDVVPSHVVLNQDDQVALFGTRYAMTIQQDHVLPGQVVYQESVAVFGSVKRFLRLRVLGPNWKRTHIFLSPTEAAYIGLQAQEARPGDLSGARLARIVGPVGEVQLKAVVVPEPSLVASVDEAERLHVSHGDVVTIGFSGGQPKLEGVRVRVHPSYKLRVLLHQGIARDLWIASQTTAHLV